jgi:hypothetical protein
MTGEPATMHTGAHVFHSLDLDTHGHQSLVWTIAEEGYIAIEECSESTGDTKFLQ